jgi:GT2 family glycosyltransferase
MEDIGHHRIKNRFVGLFSVYAKDRPDYLFETLWSILRGQTRELDRCIGVIEGQISNGLEAVVSEFSEVHWIRIPRVKNYMSFGLPTALNRGVAECHAGDIILKIDTDDWYPSDRVEQTHLAFEADKNLALFGGQISEWNQDGTECIGKRLVPTDWSEIKKFGRRRNPFNGPTVAFRYEAAQQVGGFQDVGANEDYVLWSALLQAGFAAQNTHAVLALMRGGDSLVARRSSARTRRGEFQALRAIYRNGYYGFWTYAAHVVGKQIVRRLPVAASRSLYRSVLRSESQEHEHPRIKEAQFELNRFRNRILNAKDVSAVVVSYNRFELLAEVISGLAAQRSVAEVFVVDNASKDCIFTFLSGRFSEGSIDGQEARFFSSDLSIRVRKLESNRGGAGGFAEGIRWAMNDSNNPFVWIMDDDAVPTEGCLQTLRSRSLLMDSEVTVPQIVAHGTTKMTYREKGWRPHLVTNFSTPPKSGYIDVFSFAGPLFRREALNLVSVDSFAEMFLHYDDFYFGLKLQLAGCEVFYDSEAIIDHREHSAMHQVRITERSVRLRYFGLRNRLWLLLNEPAIKVNRAQRIWAFLFALAMGLRRAMSTPKYLLRGLQVVIWAFLDALQGRFTRKLL